MLAECRIQNPHRTLSELQVREKTRRAEYRGGGQNHKEVNERGQNTEYMIEESNCIIELSITLILDPSRDFRTSCKATKHRFSSVRAIIRTSIQDHVP